MEQAPLLHPSKAVAPGDDERLQVSISDRRCPELVIALVGPVGSGVSFTASEIKSCLVDQYAYEVETYKISELIAESASLVNEKYDSSVTGAERISKLQQIGNKLRKRFASDFLAEKCVEKIGIDRIESGGYEDAGEAKVPLPKRKAHVIDSLKNPAEAQLLRDVYGDIF